MEVLSCSFLSTSYFLFKRKVYCEQLSILQGSWWWCLYGSWIIATCAISAYHHYSCEFESRSWRGALDTTLCDKFCQWLTTDRWFSPGTPVFFTNKTDHHDISEILLKVVLNTIKPTCKPINITPIRNKFLW